MQVLNSAMYMHAILS